MTNNVITVLQEARQSQESGTILILPINGSSEPPGEIELENGRVKNIEFGDLVGKDALQALQDAENLEAIFQPGGDSLDELLQQDAPSISEAITSDENDPDLDSASEAGPRLGLALDSELQEERLGRPRGLKMRTKMLLLFSVFPVVVMLALGIFYLTQINSLSQSLQAESESIIRAIAEDTIRQKSIDVAEEVDRYLRENIGTQKEDFQANRTLTSIIFDAIGETGYSVLIEAPFDGKQGDFTFWAHPNEKLISARFGQLKSALGENYHGTRKILDAVLSNRIGRSEGYYTWLDKDGSINDKFMSINRVGRTPYIIAATTYIKEFTRPIERMEKKSEDFVKKTRFVVMSIVTIAVLILATIITKYGNRISDKINNLSDITEKISKGDLNVSIEGRDDTDELGALARSVERLRTSVRIMHQRLSRKS